MNRIKQTITKININNLCSSRDTTPPVGEIVQLGNGHTCILSNANDFIL